MFSPLKVWTSQLSSLLGHQEVELFNNKLRSLNLTGLEELKLSLHMFFGPQEDRVAATVRRIGEGILFYMKCINAIDDLQKNIIIIADC